MVERRLPEVGPPSGRVPGRGLLVLPISEARRQRNRGEIAKKGSLPEVSRDGEYIGEGGSQRWTRGPRRPLARPGVGPRRLAAWATPGSPLAPLGLFAKL